MASLKTLTRQLSTRAGAATLTSTISQTTMLPPKTDRDHDLTQANAAAAAAQIAYFRAIPWCAAHLADPRLVIDQAESRRLKPSGLDALISRTLNTPGAIPAYITFFHPPPPPSSSASLSPSTSSSTSTNLIRHIQAFIALGPALNGWDGVCHGGIVATLLDEVLGQLFAANRDRGLLAPFPVMTAYLNTRYERPVLTGVGDGQETEPETEPETETGARVVLVTARMTRNEGRKYWVEGDVRGEDGAVLARAEALFIMLRSKL